MWPEGPRNAGLWFIGVSYTIWFSWIVYETPMLLTPWPPVAPHAADAETARVPLAHRVRDTVLASILSGEFAPGDRITEPEVAERLKVSRVPVREALRELESAGLLESRKHTGVFVRRLGVKETGDLYVLRSLLEAHACQAAAAHAPEGLPGRLTRLLADMDEAARVSDLGAYYNGNLAFHWAIVLACGNDQIAETYQGLVRKLHLARLTNLSSPQGMKHSRREHLAMLAAIRAGKAAEAGALASQHVLRASERFLAAMPARETLSGTARPAANTVAQKTPLQGTRA